MKNVLASLLLFSASLLAIAEDNGIVSKPSKYSVAETLDRLSAVVQQIGLTVFARIDHSGEAGKAGLKMRPTQLLIFGSPKAGTPLMNASPSLAIDLPLKALAWEVADGKVWVSYNSPQYLQIRHNVPAELIKALAGVAGLIDAALQ